MATETSDPRDWRDGLHPNGPGAVIGEMRRIRLPVGDALRLEMTNFGSAGVVHVQCYIATESGAMAVWTSCPPSLLPERMALLEKLAPSSSRQPGAMDRMQAPEARQRT